MAAAAVVLISAAGTATGLTLNALTPQERVPAGLRVEDVVVRMLLQASCVTSSAAQIFAHGFGGCEDHRARNGRAGGRAEATLIAKGRP